jgi:hypothetical protein
MSGSQSVSSSPSVSPTASSTYVPAVYSVSTFAGSGTSAYAEGTGTNAMFESPFAVAADASGNVYVGDRAGCTLRKLTTGGVSSLVAGSDTSCGAADGTGTDATFGSSIMSVAVDSSSNVYVLANAVIRKVSPGGVVSTFAGKHNTADFVDATGTDARFHGAEGLTVDASGNIYVADTGNHCIRKVTSSAVVSTLAGMYPSSGHVDATGTNAKFNYPTSVARASNGNLFIADEANGAIRMITPAGVTTTFAGKGTNGYSDGVGTNAEFYDAYGLTIDANDYLFIADNYRVRMISPSGSVTTVAGTTTRGSTDGIGTNAKFGGLGRMACDASGNIYVADYSNYIIRKLSITA